MTDATNRYEKALFGKGDTSSSRPYWLENVDLIANPLKDFVGSWAATYSNERASKENLGSTSTTVLSPVTSDVRFSQLGVPGYPELNFRPYDYGTHRLPSQLGNPISFSFVGPTAKSLFLDFQWVVTNHYATPGLGDVLTLDTISPRTTVFSGDLAINFAGGSPTLTDIYGDLSTILATSGLYVTIALTGSASTLTNDGSGFAGEGGVGDGGIGTSNTAARAPMSPKTNNSKYEIFRVVEVGANYLRLDPSKRIVTYYDLAHVATDVCRAINIITPSAARCVAIPGSGTKGKETVFAIVPPAKSLTSDLLPPKVTFDNHDPIGFNPWDNHAAVNGYSALWGENVNIPIPRSKGYGSGHFNNQAAGTTDPIPTPYDLGRYEILVDDGADSISVGDVIRIHSIETLNGGTLYDSGTSTLIADPGLSSYEGFFEVASVNTAVTPAKVSILRVRDINSDTGAPYLPATDSYLLANPSSVSERVQFKFTVHHPMSALWETPYPDIDALMSARLTGIHDPSSTGRNVNDSSPGHTPNRSDRSVFPTGTSNSGASGTNEDPGSLLDLGFRAVLFPAKIVGGALYPDFDRPITSNYVTLDSSISSPQYVEVDYKNGLVTLSHAPNPGSSDLIPDAGTLLTGDNPRKEAVFFISCVPSAPQKVSGISIYGRDALSYSGGLADNVPAMSSAQGQHKAYALATQTITCPNHVGAKISIVLQSSLSQVDIPETGFFELIRSTEGNLDGISLFQDGLNNRLGTFSYEYFSGTTLYGCRGGIPGSSYSVDASNSLNNVYAVFRKQVSLPSNEFGQVGVEYESDGSYGQSEFKKIRFPRAIISRDVDGGLTVDTRDPLTTSHTDSIDALFSSWTLSGLETTAPGGLTLQVAAGEALIQGVKVSIPASKITAPNNSTRYLYINTTNPLTPSLGLSSTASPLSLRSDFLIAKVTSAAGAITQIVDLRNPLAKVDQRIDILVGNLQDGFPSTHFDTLGEAVAYVGEIANPSSGYDGRNFRIRVVGYTQETGTIPLSVDGLYIEGTRRLDHIDSAGSRQGIHWSANAPLFDFNGKNGATIRNLSIHYDGTGTQATPNRIVFYNSALNTTEFNLIEDIYFNGNSKAHGFLYNLGIFVYSNIRNVSSFTTTDFFIKSDTDSSFSVNTIQDCKSIGVTSGYQLPLGTQSSIFLSYNNDPSLPGPPVIVPPGSPPPPVVDKNRIINNYLYGFLYGIFDNGTFDNFISGNRIEGTEYVGIVLQVGASRSGAHRVIGNSLAYIHSAAAGLLFPQKRCIWVNTGLLAKVVFADNIINTQSGASTDYGIYAQNDETLISNCIVDTCIVTANSCMVTNCDALSSIICGSSCSISNCKVGGGLTSGTSCVISGCQIAGTLTCGSSNDVSDTKCNAYTDSGSCNTQVNVTTTATLGTGTQVYGSRFSGAVTWNSQVQISNSRFGDGFAGAGGATSLAVSGSTFTASGLNFSETGSLISSSRFINAVTLSGTNLIVSDSQFSSSVTISGTNAVFSGNRVGTDVTVSGSHTVLSSNFMRGLTLDNASSGDTASVTGNRISGLIGNAGTVGVDCKMSYSSLANNSITYSVNVSGYYTALTGNIIGDSTHTSSGITYTGHYCVFTGNIIQSSVNASSSVDITAVGNQAYGINLTSATGFLIVGNNIHAAGVTPGADPQGAAPFSTAVIGNRLGANHLFGSAVDGTAGQHSTGNTSSARQNNVE